MCGLAGIFNLDAAPAPAVVLERMTQTIAHRGPDGHGVFVDRAFALGHRRLAVIDPTPRGRQPMQTRDGRYVLAYNGELYNFRELRAQLQAEGGRFTSETDTEVVLQALAAWGPAAVSRFNGMFALALWDTVEQTLLLARDRYGIKPLYVALLGRTLLFGSEIKALRAHPAFRTRVSEGALVEYLTFQNVFTDRTLFDGVHILPAGHVLRVPLGARDLPRSEAYWDFRFADDATLDAETSERELTRLFEQAVQRQLVADVPVGGYLSGGIDSGAITCVAARAVPDYRTFTCGFDVSSATGLEIACDERQKAEFLAAMYKTQHYQVVLKAGDMERVMQPLTWHLEDPRVGQSYPNYYAAHLSSRFVKVVLSGTGSDELFGGYPWRYFTATQGNESPAEYLDKYYGYWQRLVPDTLKPRLFRAGLHAAVSANDTREIFKSVHAEALRDAHTPEDYLNFSLYFEAKTFLHGLLQVEDKLHMAHGVESRVPFLDNDLVDFALRVPVRQKLRQLVAPERIDENLVGDKVGRYYARTSDGKLVLRRVLGRYVPESYATAPKQGFSAPDGSWFRGESMEYLRRLFFQDDARLFAHLERSVVQELLDDHFAGRTNRRLLIWSFLSLEWWLRTFEPTA
jgi:asparagine synthase (glutamine-hydrolysing)